ncbi:MAG: hypothetical protein IBX58_11550 [Roseovarius sp.]|nr:hypothetical protein [Roseovarius sp.]
MKFVSDLSLTAHRRYPRGLAAPGLVLDFRSGRHLANGEAIPLSQVLGFSRPGNATYADATGTIQTAATDEARTQHHVWRDGAWRRRLLIEPQRTNSLLNSSNFPAWTVQAASVNADAAVAPDGTLAADRLVENTATAEHRVLQNVPVTTGQRFSFSVYARSATRGISIMSWNSAWSARVFVDLQTGEITGTTNGAGALAAYGVEHAGNGWHRIWVSAVAQSDGNATNVIRLTDNGEFIYAGDGVSHAEIWGAQFEIGPTPSSYIPTTDAQVTRAADVVQIDAGRWPFAAGGFSVAMSGEATYSDNDLPAELRIYSGRLSGTSFTNLDIQTLGADTGRVVALQRVGGAPGVSFTGPDAMTPGVNVPFSVAARHSSDDVQLASFGVSFPPASIGLPDLSTAPFHIAPIGIVAVERLRIWAAPLEDQQLQDASR